jgi:hypothetical protein
MTLYQYLELQGVEREHAKHNLVRDWDSRIKDWTDQKIEEYCEEHDIEFTEEGNEW